MKIGDTLPTDETFLNGNIQYCRMARLWSTVKVHVSRILWRDGREQSMRGVGPTVVVLECGGELLVIRV